MNHQVGQQIGTPKLLTDTVDVIAELSEIEEGLTSLYFWNPESFSLLTWQMLLVCHVNK